MKYGAPQVRHAPAEAEIPSQIPSPLLSDVAMGTRHHVSMGISIHDGRNRNRVRDSKSAVARITAADAAVCLV